MDIGEEKGQKNMIEKLGYIPSLDGLRAFAILLVLFAHANFPLSIFENGGVGVPVFFALSGFLITTLLLEEFEKNKDLSFKAFYMRRTFRLFPALYTLLAINFIYVFFLNSEMYSKIFPEIIASGLYVYNISWLWHVKNVMLYHTWSLGVEEQFYIIWPIILYFFLKHNALKTFSILLIVFILFFFIFSSFPILHNCVFDILSSVLNVSIFIGCLVAILRWRGVFRFAIPKYFVLTCFLAILIIGFLPNKKIGTYNPFLHNLTGIFAIVIIYYLITNRVGFINKFLASRTMVFIGKISYSLYLWHLPVFRIFAMHSILPPKVSFVSKFIVSFIMALLSWYVIEKKSTLFGRTISRKILKDV